MPLPAPPPTRFADLASASERLAAARGRLEKRDLLVAMLSGVPGSEIAAAVGWLVAEPVCGALGVGPAQLHALSSTEAPVEPAVTLREVESSLAESRTGASTIPSLFARLTAPERRFLAGSLTGSLRQGSLGGVMGLALAQLSGRSEAEVRRAAMVTGSMVEAARALLGEGKGSTPPWGLELFRLVSPMLASPAATVDEAFEGSTAARLVEWKVDGVRAQVHKSGDRVAVYSRQAGDLTAGCATLLPVLAGLRARAAVLDGEVVLVAADGSARPFQDTFSAVSGGLPSRGGDALRVYLFDCLHLDGRDLLDEPLSARREALACVAPEDLRMPSVVASSADEARELQRDALARGHEGVMVKDLEAPYRAGARGGAWLKVKEHATADLVVLAVERGNGRRRGWLSNLHLGARRDDGTFCMVGKTFKGLTDALLRWQTERLGALSTGDDGYVVTVRPELVVEIRYSDVQRSPRYPGGVALRFARVARYREDKRADQADTLESLVARLPAGPDRPKRAPAARQKDSRQLSLFEK